MADRIVVLELGAILQQGPFEWLVHEPGLFREL